MRIREARLIPYRLPLHRPWVTAKERFDVRQGWVLRLATGRTEGYGDCAPLESAGTESAIVAEAWLRDSLRSLVGTEVEAALAALPGPAPPAARCAVESALLDLAARRAALPLARFLNPQAPLAVAVNGNIGALSAAGPEPARTALEQGYTVLKLKVGCGDLETEIARLRELAALLPPHARLRLDANQAWDGAQAERLVRAVSGLPIESLEEPLREPGAEILAHLQAIAPFALALDESVPAFLRTQSDLIGFPVRRIILKPMVLGGPTAALRLTEQAKAAGLECVVTGVVESAVGLWGTAHLAAALDTPLAHGLGTAEWLREDLTASPRPRDGRLILSREPGLALHLIA